MEHLRPITEQQKRTNILLAELDRPTIPHMVPDTMFEADPPPSRALPSDDEDSDAGSPERFHGKQPANVRHLKDRESFADWLTTFIVAIRTIPYLSYALRFDEPVKDDHYNERLATLTPQQQRRLQNRFSRRLMYWQRSNATLQAILMEVVKDFPAAKQLVFDNIKAKKSAMKTLTALHQTFYPMSEGRKQNAITALFSAASTISPDVDKPSEWITKLETLWQQARESGATIPQEELPSLLLQGLNKMPNSKIFAQVKMAELSKAGSKLQWPTIREETLQHEKLSYTEETKRPSLIAQATQHPCIACGRTDHAIETCVVLRKAQQIAGVGQSSSKSGGAARSKITCRTCGRQHRGKCYGKDYRKVSANDTNSSNPKPRFHDRDEEPKRTRFEDEESKQPDRRGYRPYHMARDPQNNYYQGRVSKGGMSAMIAAAVQTLPHDSFIDSCCDAVYVGPQETVDEAIAISERVHTAKPDEFIQVTHKGKIDDLPVRQVQEPLMKNLIGIGPLCDLGWKLTFEGNRLTITRDDEEIVVPRSNNLYGINLRQLSKRSEPDHIMFKVYSAKPTDELELWHNRFMHRSRRDIYDWVDGRLVRGIDKLKKPRFNELAVCTHCASTKSTRQSHKRSKADHTDGSRDHTVTVDTFGPLATECCAEYSGCRYIQTFLNIGSRAPSSAMMRNKSEAFEVLKQYTAKEFFRHYHSDGAAELTSDNTYNFLDSQDITHSHTNPYTPEQNCHVERIQRTLDEMSSAALHLANLLDEWKCHAWACAVQTLKHVPTQTDRGLMSPIEYKTGLPGNVEHLRSFGCRAWVHIPEEKRAKGESLRAHEGMFVGYAEDQPGWKIFILSTRETVTSSDVIFDELTFPGQQAVSSPSIHEEAQPQSPADFEYLVGKKYFDPDEKADFETTRIRVLNGYIVADRRRLSKPKRRSGRRGNAPESPVFVRDVEAMLSVAMKLSRSRQTGYEAQDDQNPSPFLKAETGRGSMLTENLAGRGCRRGRPPSDSSTPESTSRGRDEDELDKWSDEDSSYSHERVGIPETEEDLDLPNTIPRAMLSPEANYWEPAIAEEVHEINRRVWEIIHGPPPKKPLRTRLVFKKKVKNGKIKYKVRLVACGYDQTQGVDYTDTYSPTSRPLSLRIFCYTVLIRRMVEPRHIDVVKAYLNADIDEEIYCLPPSDPEQLFFRAGTIFKLKKALYGLKQSACLWNRNISGFLTDKLRFHRLRYEQCMYIKTDLDRDNRLVDTIILVYVDDLIVTSERDYLRDLYIRRIAEYVETTDEGFLSEYLGVNIKFEFKNGRRRVHLDQSKYIEKKLREFGMSNCRGAVTPLTRGVRFSQLETLGRIDFPYRQMLGSLIHAMNWTRPDLAYAINMLSRFAARPTLRATNEITRVFQYLKKTIDYTLTYDIDHIEDEYSDLFNERLFAFSDSDYAGCIDTARSVSSNLVFMGPALLSWRSRRQSIVAGYASEAEYISANECVGDIQSIENIFDELDVPRSAVPVIYVDNQAAIQIALDPASMQRSRQIRVIYHRIQAIIEKEQIEIRKIDTSENHADIGTKSLDGPDHLRHCLGLGLRPPHEDDFP